MRHPLLFCSLLLSSLLTACQDVRSVTEPVDNEGPQFGKSGGGGSTVYAYTMSGDIRSADGSTPSTAKMPKSDPFIGLRDVKFTLTLVAPTGDVAQCKTGDGSFALDFGMNEGTWVGSVKIHSNGTLNFSGTRTNGTVTENVNFAVADETGGPVQAAVPGTRSYTFSYTNARHFFGSGSMYYDGSFRCVNLTLTATP